MPIEETVSLYVLYSTVNDKEVTEQIDWVGERGLFKVGPWNREWNDDLESKASLDNAIFM